MEIIHEAPELAGLVPLSSHQTQTPESFYSGPPVLYYHVADASIILLSADLAASPALERLVKPAVHANGEHSQQTASDLEGDREETVIDGVEVVVASDKLTLFRSSNSTGVTLLYPSISLHAKQRLTLPQSSTEVSGLYMQIAASDGYDDHDPDGSIALTVVPGGDESPATTGTNGVPPGLPGQEAADAVTIPASNASTDSPRTAIDMLFAAVSSCANLHPDPQSPESSGLISPNERFGAMANGGLAGSESQVMADGLPPPMPGSGGWITADNLLEHFDEDGVPRNTGHDTGIGRIRAREEDDEDPQGDDDAGRNDGEEAKWRRTQ